MAKTTLPLKPTYGLGEIDVTVINPKNNKSATVSIEFDTGSPTSTLSNRFTRLLGLNKKDSFPDPSGMFDMYMLLIKVGTLKPIRTVVAVNKKKGGSDIYEINLMGYDMLKEFKSIFATSRTITFEDNNINNINPETNVNMQMQLLRLFATYVAGIKKTVGPAYDDIYYSHPVIFYNKKTGLPFQIDMEVDTGTEFPILPIEVAKTLGIDDVKKGAVDSGKLYSVYGDFDTYTHIFTIKIGNLKPMQTRVVFSTEEDTHPLLGLGDIMKKVNIELTPKTLKYTELAAMAEAHKSFYGYPRWHSSTGKRI